MKKKIIIAVVVLILLITILSSTNSATTSNYKTSQATVKRVNDYNNIISKASVDHKISARRIKAHIAVESAGEPDAVGSIGEIGLMQMTAGALSDVNKRFLPNAPLKLIDLYEPGYSIAAGTAYLRILFEQLGTIDKASMAYNVGAKNTGIPKAKEYLEKILIYEKLF